MKMAVRMVERTVVGMEVRVRMGGWRQSRARAGVGAGVRERRWGTAVGTMIGAG